ncbi:expressed unknown protein [Seminavis robusta]|uniref:Uncharacterized protein n=1 Tax=Seminavis robusta TaxID=568900 RepID=A0A9N8HWL2_9STRA|nr:expressed unknown protein [Seminavis robusta]|eukprot:Sro2243_g320480.1 n/a (189) ;mRNA; r:14451-15017
MTLQDDTPKWVDSEAAEANDPTCSSSVDTEAVKPVPPAADDEDFEVTSSSFQAIRTLTLCARFWRWVSVAVNLMFGILSLVASSMMLFAGLTHEISGAHKMQGEAGVVIAFILLLIASGSGIYGALKFRSCFVVVPLLAYVSFSGIGLVTHNWADFVLYLLFAIPQVMLIREIRRGVYADGGQLEQLV